MEANDFSGLWLWCKLCFELRCSVGGGGRSRWKQMIHSPSSNAASMGGVWLTAQKITNSTKPIVASIVNFKFSTVLILFPLLQIVRK